MADFRSDNSDYVSYYKNFVSSEQWAHGLQEIGSGELTGKYKFKYLGNEIELTMTQIAEISLHHLNPKSRKNKEIQATDILKFVAQKTKNLIKSGKGSLQKLLQYVGLYLFYIWSFR